MRPSERQPIFFDLDHTLWDFETNSRETLSELLLYFSDSISQPIEIESFFPVYSRINEKCWELYRKHEITQAELRIRRFEESFAECQIATGSGSWLSEFAERYTLECPKKGALFPGAIETVAILAEESPLFIITNGFEEVQRVKLEYSGLQEYITEMISSESAGYRKPDVRIFDYALKRSGSPNRQHWYIGDDYETDMLGARAAGMTPIFFNPQKKLNPEGFREISALSDLLSNRP
jgi:putative hydrolase of the HAD superfamily